MSGQEWSNRDSTSGHWDWTYHPVNPAVKPKVNYLSKWKKQRERERERESKRPLERNRKSVSGCGWVCERENEKDKLRCVCVNNLWERESACARSEMFFCIRFSQLPFVAANKNLLQRFSNEPDLPLSATPQTASRPGWSSRHKWTRDRGRDDTCTWTSGLCDLRFQLCNKFKKFKNLKNFGVWLQAVPPDYNS